eukprot:scaffold128283_cov45-Phaeocystis_antarctica.AAC.1
MRGHTETGPHMISAPRIVAWALCRSRPVVVSLSRTGRSVSKRNDHADPRGAEECICSFLSLSPRMV